MRRKCDLAKLRHAKCCDNVAGAASSEGFLVICATLMISASQRTVLYNFQVAAFIERDVFNIDRVSVVRPRADLECALLLVEREELDVDRTQALVDRRRLPYDQSVGMDRRLSHQLHCEISVSAAASTAPYQPKAQVVQAAGPPNN